MKSTIWGEGQAPPAGLGSPRLCHVAHLPDPVSQSNKWDEESLDLSVL